MTTIAAPLPRQADPRHCPTDTAGTRLRLAGLARPASVARHHTRVTLTAWGLPASLVDTAELVISELATNAERHAAGPLCMRLALCPSGILLIGVRDADPSPAPEVSSPTPDAESGRGLDIVAALTQAHGVNYAVDHKDVWATLPTTGA